MGAFEVARPLASWTDAELVAQPAVDDQAGIHGDLLPYRLGYGQEESSLGAQVDRSHRKLHTAGAFLSRGDIDHRERVLDERALQSLVQLPHLCQFQARRVGSGAAARRGRLGGSPDLRRRRHDPPGGALLIGFAQAVIGDPHSAAIRLLQHQRILLDLVQVGFQGLLAVARFPGLPFRLPRPCLALGRACSSRSVRAAVPRFPAAEKEKYPPVAPAFVPSRYLALVLVALVPAAFPSCWEDQFVPKESPLPAPPSLPEDRATARVHWPTAVTAQARSSRLPWAAAA